MNEYQKQRFSPRTIRVSVKTFFFISGFIFATWASRIPELQARLHLNDAQLGSLLFALPAGLMFSMPLAGFLFNKFNSRNIMLVSSLIYITLLCGIGLVENFSEAALILFVFGATRNLFNISINTQSIGVQELYNKSIIASFHGIWSVAGFSGAAFATLLISFGLLPVQHFTIVGGIVLILISLVWRTTLKAETKSLESRPVFVLPDRPLLNLGLLAFCCMVCEGTMNDWSGIYFSKEIHAPKEFVTMGYVAFLSCMTTGRFTGDWLINRFGNRKILITSGLFIAIGSNLIAIATKIPIAITGFMICGFGVSCIMPFVFSNAGKNSTMKTGSAIVAVSTIGYLGFLTGPPLIGYLSSMIGLRYTFSAISLLGVFISLLIYKSIKDTIDSIKS